MPEYTRQRQACDFRKNEEEKNSHTKNTEMAVEGNYNQIDGIIGNAPVHGADLTDGQSYDEINELAPETLPERKQSIQETLEEMRSKVREQNHIPVDGHEPDGREI